MKISRSRAGFTMLELLAVLAIVLILSAILFPAIESAREKSLATACNQNVKQLVLAITQYEQDKGNFPAGRFFTSAGAAGTATDCTRWYNAISSIMKASERASSVVSVALDSPPTVGDSGPFLERLGAGDEAVATPIPPAGANPPYAYDIYPKAYQCPSVSNWDVASLNMSYGYNYQYLGNADPKSVVTATATNTGFVNYPVSKASVARPDRMICVADSDGTGWDAYQSAGQSPAGGPTVTRIGAYAYLIDPTFLPAKNLTNAAGGVPADPQAPGAAANLGPASGGLRVAAGTGLITLSPAAGTSITQQQRSIVSRRHKGQANVGFLDGHVDSMSREELYFGKTNIAGNSASFLSNELWNGFGIDNDTNGNGVVEPALGERIIDENEAFTVAGNGALSATVAGLYAPAFPRPAAGYQRITGLAGAYANYGPGFNQTTAAFLAGARGPTLPHVPPFDFSFQAAGVQ